MPAGRRVLGHALDADIDAALVRSLAAAKVVKGVALGFPIKLAAEDLRALKEFSTRIGLTAE